MSVVKTSDQILRMKRSAAVLADCLDMLVNEAQTKSGITGKQLDLLAETFIRDNGGIPAFKNYSMSPGVPGFPASICFSRNHVLVHGIPDDKPIEDGDILTIDCGLSIDGWFADFARLFGIGEINQEDQKIIDATYKALNAGVSACVPGNKLSDISNTIQSSIYNSKYENVLQFCGHAIGKEMHESPQVPNFGRPGRGITLKPGMVFCLEPMLLKHKVGLGVLPDRWTIVTLDGSRATHAEHMVLITEEGPEVLSLSENTKK